MYIPKVRKDYKPRCAYIYTGFGLSVSSSEQPDMFNEIRENKELFAEVIAMSFNMAWREVNRYKMYSDYNLFDLPEEPTEKTSCYIEDYLSHYDAEMDQHMVIDLLIQTHLNLRNLPKGKDAQQVINHVATMFPKFEKKCNSKVRQMIGCNPKTKSAKFLIDENANMPWDGYEWHSHAQYIDPEYDGDHGGIFYGDDAPFQDGKLIA